MTYRISTIFLLALLTLFAASTGASAQTTKTFYCMVHADSGLQMKSGQRPDGLYEVKAADNSGAEAAANAAAKKEHNETPEQVECASKPDHFNH
jgi:hypothetical protein